MGVFWVKKSRQGVEKGEKGVGFSFGLDKKMKQDGEGLSFQERLNQ